MSGGFDDLTRITDAVYRADLARLQTIAVEENALRTELAALAEEERRNALTDPDSMLALRQLGGDLLWKAWIGRKREALNLRLATVMARKLSAAQALRRSFGKASVAKELRDRAAEKDKGEKALRRLADEQGQMVLRAARGGKVRPSPEGG